MRARQLAAAADRLDRIRVEAVMRASFEAHESADRDQAAEIAQWKAQVTCLRTAIEAIGESVSVFDNERRLIQCNRRFAEIYDLSPEEVRPGAPEQDLMARLFCGGGVDQSADDFLAQDRGIASGAGARARSTSRRAT